MDSFSFHVAEGVDTVRSATSISLLPEPLSVQAASSSAAGTALAPFSFLLMALLNDVDMQQNTNPISSTPCLMVSRNVAKKKQKLPTMNSCSAA